MGGVIGMTNMPEAKLAREAQIAYTTLALVTDLTVGSSEAHVSADMALANLLKNAGRSRLPAKPFACSAGSLPAKPTRFPKRAGDPA
jgi:purine nucleoside phosphorylase